MSDIKTLKESLTASQASTQAMVELPRRFDRDNVYQVWNNGVAVKDGPLRIMNELVGNMIRDNECSFSFSEVFQHFMRKKINAVGTTFIRSGRGNYYLQWLFKNTAIISFGFDTDYRLRRFAIPYVDDLGVVRYMFMFADSDILKPNRGMESTYNMSAFLLGDLDVIEEFVWFSKNMEPAEDRELNARMTDFKITSNGIVTREVVVPIKSLRMPKQSFYPYIEENIYTLFDKFMQSSSNIWLLTGPKGTGKTTLLRALVAHSKCTGNFCSDTKTVLHSDGIAHISNLAFHEKPQLIIIEDASEEFLCQRTEGNTGMASILNTFEGALPATGKLIISTNVTDVGRMDSALVRPGRCFAVTSFRELTLEECNRVLNDMERENISQEQYDAAKGNQRMLTLASLLNLDVPSIKAKSKSFGFV